MDNTFYIWRDGVDRNSFLLGVKWERLSGTAFTAWTTLHVDGIGEMFGGDFEEACQALEPGKAVEVRASMEIVT